MILRPGLASDRSALDAALTAMSRESLRRRFFSGGMPPSTVIGRLVGLDDVDHFAWVKIDGPDSDGNPLGSARFFRSASDSQTDDVSFGVVVEPTVAESGTCWSRQSASPRKRLGFVDSPPTS